MPDYLIELAKDFFIRLTVNVVSPFVIDYIRDYILKKNLVLNKWYIVNRKYLQYISS